MTGDKMKRSPAMEEVYQSSPDPLVRGANLVFLLVLILLIAICALVTFTRTINVRVSFAENNKFNIESSSSQLSPEQQAVLTIASYPPEEYGYLKGMVQKTADGSMIVVLEGIDNKNIPLTRGLQGNAEVVIGEESLLERLGKVIFSVFF